MKAMPPRSSWRPPLPAIGRTTPPAPRCRRRLSAGAERARRGCAPRYIGSRGRVDPPDSDLGGRVIARATRPAVLSVGTPREQGICVCPTAWTNVLHRDGRRSRPWRADVAQLVAHHLAKVRVAGSNPVIRSRMQWHQPQRWSGRVVRQRPAKPCTRVRFPSPPPKLLPARLAQRESASLTRKRSLVQSQYRAPCYAKARAQPGPFSSPQTESDLPVTVHLSGAACLL